VGRERYRLEVGGVAVDVERKAIRHSRLAVYPPDGRVRVSVPRQLDEAAVREVILSRLDWIRRKRALINLRPRQPRQRLVSGESHYYQGRRYRLEVLERVGAAPGVELHGEDSMQLHIRPGLDLRGRQAVLTEWYRGRLKALLPGLVAQWETVIGVEVAQWRVRRMKTRWGSCNIGARRVWLNLDLAKVPAGCLEYVLVHEMVHLLERYHNARFHRLMDRFLPEWQLRKEELEGAPLGRPVAG
jgi:predicted metal-dependent hydrolase